MKRLIILGGVGSGKSTQAKQLAERLGVCTISTGEILRNAIAQCDDLGKQAYEYVTSGELVPDPIMIKFIRSRLQQPDVQDGWILEGYPRTAFQAEELDFLLDELNHPINRAIYLNVSEEVLKSRALQRGEMDDTPTIVTRRLEVFCDRIELLLDYYEHKQKLLTIDGSLAPQTVTELIHQSI